MDIISPHLDCIGQIFLTACNLHCGCYCVEQPDILPLDCKNQVVLILENNDTCKKHAKNTNPKKVIKFA